MNCKASVCALMRMSSGSVGSKHHFSNDGRREDGELLVSEFVVFVFCFVSVCVVEMGDDILLWVSSSSLSSSSPSSSVSSLSSSEGTSTTQSEHKHLNR